METGKQENLYSVYLMNSSPALIILAAGLGSRFGGNKQTFEIGPSNEFLLEYNIYHALQTGIRKVVLVVSAGNKEFVAQQLAYLTTRCEISYVIQETEIINSSGNSYSRSKPWGTGHATLSALPEIEDLAIVINADDYYGADPFTQAAQFVRNAAPDQLGLVAFQLKNTLSDHGSVARGICTTDAAGNLISVTEYENIRKHEAGIFAGETAFTGSEIVSMNFWILNKAFLLFLKQELVHFATEHGTSASREFQLPTLIDRAITENRFQCACMQTDEEWFGLTYFEDLAIAKQQLRFNAEIGKHPFNLRTT